jgi:hypothetical protein
MAVSSTLRMTQLFFRNSPDSYRRSGLTVMIRGGCLNSFRVSPTLSVVVALPRQTVTSPVPF